MASTNEEENHFEWTAWKVMWAIGVFIVTGVAEIMGGWFVWAAVRENDGKKKPWWFAIIGSIILISYGFVSTLQPTNNFGRVYSTYGGFFIMMSLLFGWLLDGDKPDIGDWVGSTIAMVGVLVIMFWPRND